MNLNFVQVVKGNELPRQRREPARAAQRVRAARAAQIVVSGTAVAAVGADQGRAEVPARTTRRARVYAPVTGLSTRFTYGTTGIETAENCVLSGDDPRLFGTQLTDLLTGRDPRGGSVELTINKAAQEAAYKAMPEQQRAARARGAVVALDPTHRRDPAAVSTPSFDPNQLSSHDTATAIATAYRTGCSNGPGAAAAEPGVQPALPARLGVQGGRVPRPR